MRALPRGAAAPPWSTPDLPTAAERRRRLDALVDRAVDSGWAVARIVPSRGGGSLGDCLDALSTGPSPVLSAASAHVVSSLRGQRLLQMQVLEALLRRHARDRPILVVAIDAASLERDAAWVLHHLPGLLHDASITWLCDGYRPGRSGSDGSDMPSTGAEERARFGWAALTQTEMKVARLISEGHTNRTAAAVLFVSANTISTHLKSVFAKLDVNSRVQLTRIVLQNTVADGSTAEKGHR